MRCLSLFSGAGGLDLGLEAAGFQMAASVEIDPDCCTTLRKNQRWPVLQMDAARLEIDHVPGGGGIDILAGGPPCQPFSKSGFWTTKGARGLNDPRANTLSAYIAALRIFRPRAFLLENVEGFRTGGGLDFLTTALEKLRSEGICYALSWRVINAADYGVPQKRRRFVAIGLRDEKGFEFPLETHGPRRRPYLTAWDACCSCSPSNEDLSVKGRWADLLPSVPEGHNYLWHTDRGGGLPLFGWRTRYWSFLNKLNSKGASPTIVASPSQNSGPFHWENRLLSTQELARLQTFPMSYEFHGDRASRQRQIGNAVPPLLAEVLGRAIRASLGIHSKGPLQYAVAQAREAAKVPPLDAVPAQYRALAGSHLPHAGTGKGPNPRPAAMQLEG